MSSIEDGGANPPIDPPANSSRSSCNYLSVKIALTGEPKAVQAATRVMHRLNFIGGSEWSRPVAVKNSKEIIVVAERSFWVD